MPRSSALIASPGRLEWDQTPNLCSWSTYATCVSPVHTLGTDREGRAAHGSAEYFVDRVLLLCELFSSRSWIFFPFLFSCFPREGEEDFCFIDKKTR
jgi:hypothetical protein